MANKIKYIGDTTPEVHIKRDEQYTKCGKDTKLNANLWKLTDEKVTCGNCLRNEG